MTPINLRSTALAQLEQKYLESTEMSLLDFMIIVATEIFDGVSNSDFTDYFVTNFDFADATEVLAYYDNPLRHLWNA